MKTIKKYCKKCKKETTQLKKCSHSTAERILIGIFTFGWNELVVEKWYECNKCGEYNE